MRPTLIGNGLTFHLNLKNKQNNNIKRKKENRPTIIFLKSKETFNV